MEYESRKVKWYWLALFVMFCMGVAYLLFSANPYLYSHQDLRSALTTGDVVRQQSIPSKPVPPTQLGSPMGLARYNLERTATDPLGSPRSRAYEEYETQPIDLKLEDFSPSNFVGDQSGFYLNGESPWVVAVKPDGAVAWKYRFAKLAAQGALPPVLLDESNAYLVNPNSEIVCLDKKTGQLRWMIDLRQELAAAPFLWGKNILIPVKGAPNGLMLKQVRRADGGLEAQAPKLDVKPDFHISYAPTLEAFIATADNKVVALDPEDWQVLWSQTLTDPIKGPAVIVDRQIFVATLGAKIVKLDGSKKGKVEWEADLEKPAASPPAYLPIMAKMSVLDTSGGLSVLDLKTGKVAWRQGIERSSLSETWSARLKGNNIEEFKMDWLHKGWTVWSPCGDRRVCIYTPGKGQLIQRIQLSGTPLALPVAGERSWLFFVQQKPGKFAIARLLEESEIKKLKAEAAKNAQ